MSHILIHRPHDLGHEEARNSANTVAEHLRDEFNLSYRWEGDSLHFERTGVDGHIDVKPAEVLIEVRLGMLLRPLKGRLEKEIHRYLDEIFD